MQNNSIMIINYSILKFDLDLTHHIIQFSDDYMIMIMIQDVIDLYFFVWSTRMFGDFDL